MKDNIAMASEKMLFSRIINSILHQIKIMKKKLFMAKIGNKYLKIALFHFQIGFKEYIQKKKKKAKKITGKKTRMGVRSNRAPDESWHPFV